MKKFFHRHWPILCLLVVWFIFSFPFFFKGLIPFPSDYLVSFFPPWSAAYGMPVKNNAMPDVITQIYPWKTITIDSWKTGQIPLWNPYSFAGTPHAGNYQTAVFTPFTVLFFLFNRIDAWSILILLQPLLAGIGMYVLLRTLGRTRSASSMGSIAFMFCGFITVWMAYGTLGYAALWLPFIFAGIAGYIRKPVWWHPLVISLGTALSLLSGHFQISLYVLAASFAFLTFETIRTRGWSKGLHAGVFLLLGVGIASPQLLLSFDAYRASVRSASFIQGEVIPWNYLITLFSPDFFGNPVTRNDWFGHYAEWAGFVGVVPLLLALFVLIRKKEAAVWFFAGLCVVALLFAFPTPFNDALFQMRIPALSTSAASRIIVLVSFSLAVLSSFGLDALRRDWVKREIRVFFGFAAVVMSAVVLLGLSMYFMHLLPDEKLMIAGRNTILPSLIVVLALVGAAIGFMKNKRISLAVLAGLLILTSFDLLRFATKWMPYSKREYMYPKMGVLSYLQQNAKGVRMFGNFGGEITVFGIEGIEGYDALYQERYGRFIGAAGDGKLKGPERSVVLLGKKAAYAQRVLDLLGVTFVVHRLSDGRNVWAYPHWEYPHYVSVYKDEHYEVFENTHALPRFFLASQYLVTQNDEEAIATLLDERFDAKNTIVLEKIPGIEPQKGEGDIRLSRNTPNELVFDVKTSVPKLFYLSDTFDPGWRATIDGAPSELYRANYDFRAVAVPAGNHVLRMYYWPQSLTMGLGISALSFFGILAWMTKNYYDHRYL